MENIKNACTFIFEKLFDERTNLIYDGLYKSDELKFLPTAEEIALLVPNPCGWGTNMEDSVLNGACMLEAMMNAYYIEKDENDRKIIKERIKKLASGLMLCATIGSKKGFIARSVLPSDQKSHYTNSSRDQYTHWLAVMYKYYLSDFSDQREKDAISEIFVEVASLAEKEVIPENNYTMKREDDSGLAMVMEMWGNLGAHEYFRLLMMYGLAYATTSNRHWKDKLNEYREKAYVESDKIDLMETFYIYPLLQMQYSLLIMYMVDDDVEYKQKYLKLMQKVADIVKSKELSENVDIEKAYAPMHNGWRTNEIKYLFNRLIHGAPYFISVAPADYTMAAAIFRNASESIMIQAMCPDYQINQKEIDAFYSLVDKVDYSRITSYAPVLLVDAYYLLKRK